MEVDMRTIGEQVDREGGGDDIFGSKLYKFSPGFKIQMIQSHDLLEL